MRVLLTGGTGFVGRQVLKSLTKRGAELVFTYHRNEALAKDLAAQSGARAEKVDLRSSASISELVERLPAGPFDAMIHCATKSDAKRLEEISESDWSEVMEINARSAFLLVSALVPRMREKGGNVVLVAGTDAVPTAPTAPHFAASQAAIAGFARASAADLGRYNIRINVVALGVLDGGASNLLSDEKRENAQYYSAFKRVGTASEVAASIAWLALHNTYIHGQVVALTGGL